MYYGRAVMERYSSGDFSRVEFVLQGGQDRALAYCPNRTEPKGSLVQTLHCPLGMIGTDLIPAIHR